MTNTERQHFEQLILNCKSELLNHTLQSDAVSPHIKNINSYLDQCIEILKSDAQENLPLTRSRTPKMYGGDKDNILFFAYCMSKWDAPFVRKLTGESFNQTESFKYLSSVLPVKFNTLKNYRDVFDSHVDQQRSNREGWKTPLKSEYKEIIRQYDSLSEEQLLDIGKGILES